MRRLPWILVAAGLGVASVAVADNTADVAVELSERGAEAFEAGDYDEAFELYDEAVRIHAHPTYIFNRARAAAALEDCESAKADYRLYLRLPENDPQALEAARLELTRLATECKQRPRFSATGSIREMPQNQMTPPATVAQLKRDPRRNWRIAAISSGIATVGIIGYAMLEGYRVGNHYPERVQDANAGLASPITTSDDSDICEASGINDPEYASVKRACDDGRAAALRANIASYGGLLGVVATSVFVYKGWIAADNRVELRPSGPGGVGASAAVRF